MATALKTETLIILGVGLAALVMAKLATDKAGQVLGDAWDSATDAVKSVVPYVNPADEKNIVNQGAQNLYQAATGSTGTIGTDLYDANHGGVLTDMHWYDYLNPAVAVGGVAAAAAKQSSVGQSIKSWWDGL